MTLSPVAQLGSNGPRVRRVKMDPRCCPRPRPAAGLAADRGRGLRRLPTPLRGTTAIHPGRRPHAPRGRNAIRPWSQPSTTCSPHIPSARRPCPRGFGATTAPGTRQPGQQAVRARQVLTITAGSRRPPLKAEPTPRSCGPTDPTRQNPLESV